jgi:hypothetical protein
MFWIKGPKMFPKLWQPFLEAGRSRPGRIALFCSKADTDGGKNAWLHEKIPKLGKNEKFKNSRQGCQIFLGKTYQNGKNLPNDHKIYQMTTKYIYQMTTKYTK